MEILDAPLEKPLGGEVSSPQKTHKLSYGCEMPGMTHKKTRVPHVFCLKLLLK